MYSCFLIITKISIVLRFGLGVLNTWFLSPVVMVFRDDQNSLHIVHIVIEDK